MALLSEPSLIDNSLRELGASKECSIEQIQKLAQQILSKASCDSAALDAAVLLCHVLDKPRSYLFTWPEKILATAQQQAFAELIARRVQGEPVAYIVGYREFWSLNLKVAPSTLIPRPDTERLVEIALDKASLIQGDILDLGTGTGAIALALASELPTRSFFGIDLKDEAVALAKHNAQQLQLKNAHFQQSSWFDAIKVGTKFALIVSNPPYIDGSDPHLAEGDVRFEPRSALIAENHGLADILHIATHARDFLLESGWLLFEHGYDQGDAVRQILADLGYQQIVTEQDYGQRDRVTFGCFIK